MSLKDQAHALLAEGLRPIPLGGYQEAPPSYFVNGRCKGDADLAAEKWPKTPRLDWKEYQEREPTEEEVESWWSGCPTANIGILTGCEVHVVDADSVESMEWVETYLTATPWRVSTGKGKHYYFSVSPDVDVRNTASTDGKIDIRGVGGYVVAAGSRHPSGRYYGMEKLPGFDCDFFNELPRLTGDDVARIKAHNRQAKQEAKAPRRELPPGTFVDLSLFGADAIGEPAKEGSRNNELARLTGLLFRQGFSLLETMAKAVDWNEKNVPPLAYEELKRTVESVSNTHLSNTGQAIPIQAAPEKQVESLMFKLGDLVKSPPDPPEAYWGDKLVFTGSRVLIAGAPKIGKSNFALAMAVQACCGGAFLDKRFTRPLRVMWMQAEIHRAWLLDRIGRVTPSLTNDERALVNENLILSGRLDLDITIPRDFQAIQKTLNDHRPDVWIIDPIINFSSAEENSNVEVQKILRTINGLAGEVNCAPVLVHHAKKSGAGDPIDMGQIRGASAFRGWYDTGVLLTGESEKPLVTWEARNNASPHPHHAAFDEAAGLYRCESAPDEDAKRDRAEATSAYAPRVLAILERGPVPIHELMNEISNQHQASGSDVRTACAELAKTKQIEYFTSDDGFSSYRLKTQAEARSVFVNLRDVA